MKKRRGREGEGDKREGLARERCVWRGEEEERERSERGDEGKEERRLAGGGGSQL